MLLCVVWAFVFFFNDTATTEIYTLSLHDALPICPGLAFALGFVFPGLGAVYNGQYNKALVHLVVFATFIFGLSSNMDDSLKAVFGILLPGFIFYMASDPIRTPNTQPVQPPTPHPFQT